jgi:hypothetical protein
MLYSELMANVMARFIDDAFHRGLLWRLPIRVVENLPRLYLDFLLEGSPYYIPVVEQFLRLHTVCDWYSWASRGYGTVRSVPIHLVERQYRIKELGSLIDFPRAGTHSRDEEGEQLIAEGIICRRGVFLGVQGTLRDHQ